MVDSQIAIARNIARLRKEEKLTQEDLAAFLGVTKASVSKWETGQSYPDIALLPRIATFFGTSIDELIGYEPQMTRQNIRATCARLRKAFAEEPFEEAHAACQRLVCDYYSCYPLLMQIAMLYLNHLGLVDEEERRSLVEETIDLCRRVRHGSTSSSYIRQAEGVEATLLLLNGDAQGASELLTDAAEPDMGADIILARALNALGKSDEADEALQAMLYQALILNLNRLIELAFLHAAEHERLVETHRRALLLIEAFELDACYVNVAAVHASFAMAFMMGGDADNALDCLEDYERSCRALTFPLRLHGDAFFDKIDAWLDRSIDSGAEAPLDDALTKRNMLAGIVENPLFAPLSENPRYMRIVKSLEEVAR